MKLAALLIFLVSCANYPGGYYIPRGPSGASPNADFFKAMSTPQELHPEKEKSQCRTVKPVGNGWCDYMCVQGRWVYGCQ